MRLFFPYGKISQVSSQAAQQALIKLFKQWGKPKSIRIDNGKPLGDPQRKSLPIIALWLEAIDITVIYNRPRRPTDNAKVERMQQTTKNWAEIKSCKDIDHLRQKLRQIIIIQREKFKVRRMKGKTRLQAFPKLLDNPNKYKRSDFNVKQAYSRLAQWSFVRRTSKIGQFTLYGQVYYLGKQYAKQNIIARFNAATVAWQIKDSQANVIKGFPAKNFNANAIRNLTIGQRTRK